MNGSRLEAVVNIMTCHDSFATNISKAVEEAGYSVSNIVMETLASSLAVLTSDEKELGVLLVDVGGGTTDCILFLEKKLEKTFYVDLGGNNLTKDLAICLRTPLIDAEEYKIEYGGVWKEFIQDEEMIEVKRIGGQSMRMIEHSEFVKILEPRMEEVFTLVKREIQKMNMMDSLAAGVVLTGGAIKLDGTLELAEEVFELPVRLGVPNKVEGVSDVVDDPQYSTGVGLVMYGLEMERGYDYLGEIKRERRMFSKFLKELKKFFKDIF
jgi:cell division protein FtsA